MNRRTGIFYAQKDVEFSYIMESKVHYLGEEHLVLILEWIVVVQLVKVKQKISGLLWINAVMLQSRKNLTFLKDLKKNGTSVGTQKPNFLRI